MDAEITLRTTGLPLSRRNPGDRTDPVCQPATAEGNNVLSKGNHPSSAGLWLGTSPPGRWFLPLALPWGTASYWHRRQSNLTSGGYTGRVIDSTVPGVDALGSVALLSGTPWVPVLQDPVDDAGEGLLLSLSKGWASWAETVGDSPAGPNRPACCARCPGAGQTSAQSPGCSSPPPSSPCEPADIRPPCTSVAPSVGSSTTLWMTAGGTVFNRQIVDVQRKRPR